MKRKKKEFFYVSNRIISWKENHLGVNPMSVWIKFILFEYLYFSIPTECHFWVRKKINYWKVFSLEVWYPQTSFEGLVSTDALFSFPPVIYC